MSNELTKWAIGNEMRDEEYEEQYTRLVELGACKEKNRARVKKAWIEAERPPVVTFIRENG